MANKTIYLTTGQVATILGTTRVTIANHARNGKIKGAIMIHPKMWLIPESEIKNINISHEKSPIKKEG